MPAHDALLFTIPIAFFFRVALVVILLAFGQGHFRFDLVALPIQGGGDDGVTVPLHFANQLIDFLPMEQQLPVAPVVGDDVR